MSDISVTVEGPFLAIREQDGEQLPHRRVLAPGRMVAGQWRDTPLSAERKAVRDAAVAAWTPEVVAAFRAEQEAFAANQANEADAQVPEAEQSVSVARLRKALKLLNPSLTMAQIDTAITETSEP